MRSLRSLLASASLCWLASCGGGGGSEGAPSAPPPPPPVAELSVSVASPARRVPIHEYLWYDIVVTNHGPVDARNIELLHSVSSGMPTTFDLGCYADDGSAVCPANGSNVVPLLPVNGTLRYRSHAHVAERGTHHLDVYVRGVNISGNVPVRLTVEGYSADLQVAGQAPAGELPGGTTATYTMEVFNAGPDDATEVLLSNELDHNVRLSSITCAASGGAQCPARVSATAGMRSPLIPVGGRLAFTVQGTPWPGTIGPVTNRLRVSAWGDPYIYDNSATARAHVAVPPGHGTLVHVVSDEGDYIGQGQSHVYDNANASIRVEAVGSRLNISVKGNKWWDGNLQLPGALSRLQPGSYVGLQRLSPAPTGGLYWGGDGRGCNSLSGSATVHEVTYAGDALQSIDLSFEQHCEGATPALRGRVRWRADDTTPAPAPIDPPPAELWRAADWALPSTGSFLYLRAEPYAPDGAAAEQLYTLNDSVISVNANAWRLDVRAQGDQHWLLNFRAMENLTDLRPGYYRELTFGGNPARGSLAVWSLVGCSVSMGWVAIDSITYTAGVLSAIDMRFERRCEDSSQTLRGRLRWDANDTTSPPLPQWPLPADLWAPPADSTPATGSYVYLESDPGDYIGQGVTRLLTGDSARFVVRSFERRVSLQVWEGDRLWSGSVTAMTSIPRLGPGLYPGVLGSVHNPTRGGLSWGGDGRGCNQSWGWFAVDHVAYDGDEIAALTLRFEQHCEFMQPALRGKIHWVR